MVLKVRVICLLVYILSVGCSYQTEDHKQLFQAELDKIVSSKFDWTPGVSMSVYAPNDHIDWSGTAGVSELKNFQDLSVNQPFRIASVTKSFVAVAILRLQEEGLLSIEDPIQTYISNQHNAILKSGGYDPAKITIRQCLNHTSGLYDYVLGTHENPSPYLSIIVKNPKKRWTRTEQLEGAIQWGKPKGTPGEIYHYGDTGYILLGEIIEKLSNKSLGYAIDSLVNYEKIGMRATWLESMQEVKVQAELIHCYYQRKDYSEFDASIDLYGGGGLISTTRDLALFYYHLFNGNIFKYDTTIGLMLSPTKLLNTSNESDEQEDYRLGVQVFNLYDGQIVAHSGLWDTYVLYSPKHNVSMAIKFTDGGNEYLIKKTISIINKIQELK
ncbi:MAG: serine hydrolase domain-containing protein [Bacteroidota bacterium]